jgi:hypothetical protein
MGVIIVRSIIADFPGNDRGIAERRRTPSAKLEVPREQLEEIIY